MPTILQQRTSESKAGRKSGHRNEPAAVAVVSWRIPTDLYKRVRIEAIERNTNVQQLCNAAIKHYLDNAIDG